MGVWDVYEDRIHTIGFSKRDASIRRVQRNLRNNLKDSASYHGEESLIIDSIPRNAAIIDTDNLNIKFIYSMPGEDIPHGGIVEWMDNHWLITERDANNEVYTRAKIEQCNYVVKWIDSESVIHEQWCIVEDGTKYMTGVYEDRDYITTRGDSRIAVTFAKNDDTTKLRRGTRFLIDDPGYDFMLAYELTKPNKLSNVFNGAGVFKFVLQECNTTEYDNLELGIADYYRHFLKNPSDDGTDAPSDSTTDSDDRKKVWL